MGASGCINLRRLKAKMVKDAYCLPRIDDTLDSVNGAKLFRVLDLKLGYWHVELDEASKPLTAFTAGLLGFYECKRMPFGLTSELVNFKRFMGSCLGYLHLN